MASHAKGCCFFRGNGVGVEKAGTVMLKVSSCFILNFKLGDNINHNLSVLALLYDYYNREDEDGKRLLCKPIIILLVSIIEAVLHDFHSRIRILTAYYNESRIHRSLDEDAPFHRAIERVGAITSQPVLGGLHHQYCRI